MGFLRNLVACFLLTAFLCFSTVSLGGTVFAQVTPGIEDKPAEQVINEGLCAGANLEVGTEGNCEQVGESGVEKINRIIRSAINTLSLIVGVVAVIMIIIGGLRYITSGGSDTSVTSAKNTILYAIIGLIIVAIAQVLVRFVLRQITE